MNRAAAFALAAVVTVTVPAAADAGVRIENRAANCSVDGIDGTMRFVGDDLVVYKGRERVAAIGPDYSLTVRGESVALTPAQQFDVAMYRTTYDVLVAEAKEIGAAGARFGIQAAFTAIAGLFTGKADEVEARIEAEAAAFEARAAELCGLAASLEAQHRALVTAVPEFGRAVQ